MTIAADQHQAPVHILGLGSSIWLHSKSRSAPFHTTRALEGVIIPNDANVVRRLRAMTDQLINLAQRLRRPAAIPVLISD
jgi:hypothetical protein